MMDNCSVLDYIQYYLEINFLIFVTGSNYALNFKSFKKNFFSMTKVCIIGAGASGITAIKCCLDENIEPVCFERSFDLGGMLLQLYNEMSIISRPIQPIISF